MAPQNVIIERVEHPTEQLADEASEILGVLMRADPCALSLTGGDLDLVPDFGSVMIRSLTLCPGVSHMWTARDETGALVGYTIFSLPGQLMCSTDEQREKGRLMEYMGKLPPQAQQYYAETMGGAVPKANDEAFGIEGAERNTYWCNVAMVRADYQGKGVAKAMFELAYKEAAKTGETVALTTTNIRNVAIYEKIGLKLYGEKKFPSPWADWTLWFFAKETKGDSVA